MRSRLSQAASRNMILGFGISSEHLHPFASTPSKPHFLDRQECCLLSRHEMKKQTTLIVQRSVKAPDVARLPRHASNDLWSLPSHRGGVRLRFFGSAFGWAGPSPSEEHRSHRPRQGPTPPMLGRGRYLSPQAD